VYKNQAHLRVRWLERIPDSNLYYESLAHDKIPSDTILHHGFSMEQLTVEHKDDYDFEWPASTPTKTKCVGGGEAAVGGPAVLWRVPAVADKRIKQALEHIED